LNEAWKRGIQYENPCTLLRNSLSLIGKLANKADFKPFQRFLAGPD